MAMRIFFGARTVGPPPHFPLACFSCTQLKEGREAQGLTFPQHFWGDIFEMAMGRIKGPRAASMVGQLSLNVV